MKHYFICFVVIFFVGCSQSDIKEQDHAAYILGRKFVTAGNFNEALPQFLKVIKEVPSAQNAYLEVGQIYLTAYDDPVFAIYYFREFLERSRNPQNKALVDELIETAKKRFIQQITGANKELYSSQQNFLSLLRHLREENERLRAQINAQTAK